jgi:hypothetical protein
MQWHPPGCPYNKIRFLGKAFAAQAAPTGQAYRWTFDVGYGSFSSAFQLLHPQQGEPHIIAVLPYQALLHTCPSFACLSEESGLTIMPAYSLTIRLIP